MAVETEVAEPGAEPAEDAPVDSGPEGSGESAISPESIDATIKAGGKAQQAKPPAAGATQERSPDGKFLGKDGKHLPEEPKPPAPKTYKFKTKVDGKESEDEYDEQRIVRALQIEGAGRKRLEEFSAEKKDLTSRVERAESFIKQLVSDPSILIDAMKHAGIGNPIQHLAGSLKAVMDREQMDPRDREMLTLKEQNAALQRSIQQGQQQQLKKQTEFEAQQTLDEIGRTVIPIVEKLGLPKSDLVMDRIVKHHFSAKRAGLPADPDDIASLVHEEISAEFGPIVEKMSGAELIKRYPGAAKKIADELRAKFKAKQAAAAQQAIPEPPPTITQEQRRKRGLSDREIDQALGIRR